MKTANELYEITQKQIPKIVENIMDGVKEHIIQRCEEEALKGATYYEIYLKHGIFFVKDKLLEECIKLAKEFEDNGYKVSIEDDGNGYYVNFIMRFTWHGEVVRCRDVEILYDTDNGCR